MRRVRFLFGGSETPRFLSGWGLALAVLVGLGLVCPSPCFADPIDLGQAGSLTIFGFNGSTVSFTNPQTLVSGPAGTTPNVGIGPNSSLNASDGTITGTLFVDPTATHIAQGNLNVLGGVVTKDLSGAVSDLTTLSATSAVRLRRKLSAASPARRALRATGARMSSTSVRLRSTAATV